MPDFSNGGGRAGRSPAELLFLAATMMMVFTTVAREAHMPVACDRPENCGAAQVLRLLPAGFTGCVELHISDGIISCVKVIQHHPRARLTALAAAIAQGRGIVPEDSHDSHSRGVSRGCQACAKPGVQG